ncbi:Hypothetical predicted protein [Paramuricea clavata]|uniref:Uncharacterized protein n=1 Tax=Paramuricea clavata TaxID=317549 RepID=A0A6S7I0N4_PARCT|nr:Hypothetical predicted protein [Paramuricea clavata]
MTYFHTELILFLFLSYRKDRARHEQLARERLAALKAKRAEKEAAIIVSNEDEQRYAIEAKLQNEQDKEKDILSQEALELQQGGVVAVHEAILKEVEKKHSIEIKMLSELLDVSESDADAVAAASYLNNKQRVEKMADLYRDFKEWKTATVRASKNAGSEFNSKEEKDENVLRAADRQMKLMRILKDGIVLKVLNVKEELTGKNIPEPNLKDELGVMLVANLQEKQNTESRAVENILAEKEVAVLNLIKDEQRRIRQECIVDNLAAVILQKDQEETLEGNSDVSKAENENEKQFAEMEAELEVERQRRFLTGASEAEINAALSELRRQQEAKKQALNATLEHQRNLAKAKLEARRRRRDDKQYEEDIATSLLMMAEQESSLVREKTMIQRSKQGESLQERLARRREERAKRKAQEELERNTEESKDEIEQDENDRPKAASAGRVVERTEKLKGRKSSLPEGFSMKREKTVVDVEVSEDKKKEIVGSLLREHTQFGVGIERERKRQEDIVSNLAITFVATQLLAFEKGVLAFEKGVLAFDNQVLPFEKRVLLFEKGVLPFEKGVLAFEMGVLAFEKGVLPFEKGVLPFEKGVLPFEKGVLAFEKGVLAFEKGVLAFVKGSSGV